MPPSESKRDAVEAAARPLRERRRAQTGQLAAAESALRRADRERDRALRGTRARGLVRGEKGARGEAHEREPEGADALDHRARAIAETRTVLGELDELVEEDEEVLDMAAAVSAGHDGVLVVTDRRLIFVAPRRTVSLHRRNIAGVEVRGRRLGTRIVVYLAEGRTTFSGIRLRRARELAKLVGE